VSAFADFRCDLRKSASPRPMSFTLDIMAGGAVGRTAAKRPAAGVCGDALVKSQFLSLHSSRLAARRPRDEKAAGLTSSRGPQQPLAASLLMPTVISRPDKWGIFRGTRLGTSRFIVSRSAARRFCIRQGAAHPDASRMVHAPKRSDPRVRMGVSAIVNPPGARVGRPFRVLSDRRKKRTGRGDRSFLERVFPKACCSIFTLGGSTARTPRITNVFEGGFLGLDNIGVFDRSQPMPLGGRPERKFGRHELDGRCTA